MRYEEDKVDKVLLENEIVIEHKIDKIHFMDRPHFHDGLEIHFTLTNNTSYHVDERTFKADAGAIALFNSEQIHRVIIDRNKLYERYYLLFKPRFIEDLVSNYLGIFDIFSVKRKFNVIQLSSEQQLEVINLYSDLIRIVKDTQTEFSELKTKIKLVELLLWLNTLLKDQKSTGNLVEYEHNQQMSELVRYIQTNYYKNIKLDDLCEKYFISKSTINRMFNMYLGMSPNQYIIYTRIIKSRYLLEQGYSVKDVCQKIGYSDESSFIKKFREIQGESPKQYSINYRRKNE